MKLDSDIKVNLSSLQNLGTPMSEVLCRTNNAKVPTLKELKEQCGENEIIVALGTYNKGKNSGKYEPQAVVKPITQEWDADHLREDLIENRTLNGAFIYKIDRNVALANQSTRTVFDVEESYVTKGFDKGLNKLREENLRRHHEIQN